MNAMTARALSLGVVVALWTVISHYAKLPLLLWLVVAGLGCFMAAGGGIPALQRTVASMLSGVVWALVAYAVSRSLGHSDIVDALVFGAAVAGIALQARVPLLSYTGGALIGAGATMGSGVRSLDGGVRVITALVIGTALGYAAAYGADKIMEGRRR